MLTSNHFHALYAEYLESGLTIRNFCANHQIRESKFYYWHKRLRRELPSKEGFVPVVFDHTRTLLSSQVSVPLEHRLQNNPEREAGNNFVSCEINYPNGIHVKLSGVTDPGLLRSLLHLSQP